MTPSYGLLTYIITFLCETRGGVYICMVVALNQRRLNIESPVISVAGISFGIRDSFAHQPNRYIHATYNIIFISVWMWTCVYSCVTLSGISYRLDVGSFQGGLEGWTMVEDEIEERRLYTQNYGLTSQPTFTIPSC